MGALAGPLASLNNYFRIKDRESCVLPAGAQPTSHTPPPHRPLSRAPPPTRSTFWVEFQGGMTTFFSMCYILALNGVILNAAKLWKIPGDGFGANGIFFATALASGIFTIVMGLVANAPIALAPGMGLNGYFYLIAAGGGSIAGLGGPNALGAVFLSGVFYTFFVSLCAFR